VRKELSDRWEFGRQSLEALRDAIEIPDGSRAALRCSAAW
jgi:hypothetical protein